MPKVSSVKVVLKKNCGCYYNPVFLFKLIADIVIFILAINILAKSDDDVFGNRTLTPILKYGVGAFITTYLVIVFDFVTMCRGMGIFGYTANVIVELMSLILFVRILPLTSQEYIDRSMEVTAANWRIEFTYQRYQSNNGCSGLQMLNDSCLACCDVIFKDQLAILLNTIKKYNFVAIAFGVLSLLLVTLPTCITQCIFDY